VRRWLEVYDHLDGELAGSLASYELTSRRYHAIKPSQHRNLHENARMVRRGE